jgi:hypothetical protein
MEIQVTTDEEAEIPSNEAEEEDPITSLHHSHHISNRTRLHLKQDLKDQPVRSVGNKDTMP